MACDRKLLKGAVRTTVVVIVAVFLTGALPTAISFALARDLRKMALYRYDPRLAPEMGGREQQIRRAVVLLRYVADPIGGLGVGLFVGLFQRRKPALVAAVCWAPQVLLVIFGTSFLRFPTQTLRQLAPGVVLTILCSALVALTVGHLRQKRGGSPTPPRLRDGRNDNSVLTDC